MPSGYRARLYRTILLLAFIYNLAFGLWAGLWPRSFFHLLGMAPPRYPAIWQCLGMVIGLYGLAYGYAALRLERAWPFVAIGLLGKVLGPIGWCFAVARGEFPFSTFPLILFNDLLWWLPFALFLLEPTRAGERLRRSAPFACAALNALAALALLVLLRQGTEANPDLSARANHILEHPIAWRGGWGLWIAAALSLVAFYAWWGARLPNPLWGQVAFLVALLGFAGDTLAESLFVSWLPERLETIGALGSLLSGGLGNGLYTVAGTILTLATRSLPRTLSIWSWTIWACGYGLTGSVLLRSTGGAVAFTALLVVLFCPWAWVMGKRLS